MRLYGYYLSSNVYRARVALNLKGVAYDDEIINVLEGDAASPQYKTFNPQAKVPALRDGDVVVTQSLAILEYLDEKIPDPPFLPSDLAGRARVRSLSLGVVGDIFPLLPSRIRNALANDLNQDEAGVRRWCHDWVCRGLETLEASLVDDSATGTYCHGDSLTMADICLASTIQVARRYDCDLNPYPTVAGIYGRCEVMTAFQDALAVNQADAPPDFKGL
jgi:maleylacetoacetate isomerase/maleylpyruvate isomerase